VFSADIGVEASSQVLDILGHACRRFIRPWRIPSTGGTGSSSASRSCPADLWREISTENPNFEIASSGFCILPHVRAKTYVTANYSFKWSGGGGLFRLKNILSSQIRRSSARHPMPSAGRFYPERYRIETRKCCQK
jgi:hypothetical protein